MIKIVHWYDSAKNEDLSKVTGPHRWETYKQLSTFEWQLLKLLFMLINTHHMHVHVCKHKKKSKGYSSSDKL